MKNSLVFIILFTLVGFTNSPSKVQNNAKSELEIVWSNTPLTWADFHGKMKKTDPYDAVTLSAISSGFSGNNQELTFKVQAVFFPKGSKKKIKKQDDKLLNHEQGHFDITEVYARLFRQALQQQKYKDFKTISKTVDKLYTKNYIAWKKNQNQYDKDTEHSKNELKQQEWDHKIKSQLDMLEDYKATSFKVDISYLN